jgi:adenylate cyclase
MSAMLDEIENHGGTLDKVMGDGLMAVWGAPGAMPPDEQAHRAVAAAIAMQGRLGNLGESWTVRGLTAFQARIGIHQDVVAVGDIGAAELWSYTAIGSGVNLASRLEGAASPGSILLSDSVHRHVAGEWPFRGPQVVPLKGLAEPVAAWEIVP